MKFEQPKQLSREELSLALTNEDPHIVSTALISAALYDSDRAFVEGLIEQFIRHKDSWIRGSAATATGHLARIHGTLDFERMVPLIRLLLNDPNTNGSAEDALDDIQIYCGVAK
jgi:HEAT repeat protein